MDKQDKEIALFILSFIGGVLISGGLSVQFNSPPILFIGIGLTLCVICGVSHLT